MNDTLMIWASIFVLLVVILAATLPMWVPALLRFVRQDLARIELAELDRWEREMQRQQLDYEVAVQRSAQRRGLPDAEWPALAEQMDRWLTRYRAGEITWQTALCEAESWISRRVRLANVATSQHLGGPPVAPANVATSQHLRATP